MLDSGAGMPSASIVAPSIIKVPNTRLVKKPRKSLTTIGSFPKALTTSKARATISSSVRAPRMISSSFISCTGEQQCRPTNFLGRALAEARSKSHRVPRRHDESRLPCPRAAASGLCRRRSDHRVPLPAFRRRCRTRDGGTVVAARGSPRQATRCCRKPRCRRSRPNGVCRTGSRPRCWSSAGARPKSGARAVRWPSSSRAVAARPTGLPGSSARRRPGRRTPSADRDRAMKPGAEHEMFCGTVHAVAGCSAKAPYEA